LSKEFNKADIVSMAAIAAWLGLAAWATYGVFVLGHAELHAENGLIENLQAGLLVAACAIYLATAALEKRPDKPVLLACALLCYGFVVRELDVETFAIPQVLIAVGSGVGRTVSLALAFGALGLYVALTGPARHVRAAVAFARSRPGRLFLAGCVFLVIGDRFEQATLLTRHVFLEEMAELFGYLLILLSSIAGNAYLHRPAIRSAAASVGEPRSDP
jgi:hypothetical protein